MMLLPLLLLLVCGKNWLIPSFAVCYLLFVVIGVCCCCCCCCSACRVLCLSQRLGGQFLFCHWWSHNLVLVSCRYVCSMMFSWPASEDECVDSASQCSTSKSGDGHEKTAERNWWEGEDCCSTEKGFAVQLLQQTMEAGYLKVPWCFPHTILWIIPEVQGCKVWIRWHSEKKIISIVWIS